MSLFMRLSLYLSYFIPLYKLQTMDTQTLSCQAEINWLPGKTSFGTWVPANWTRSCYLAQIVSFPPIFSSSRFLQYLATTFQTNFSNLSAFCLVASLRTTASLSIFFLGLLVALQLAIGPRTWRRSGSWSSIAWYKAWSTIHHTEHAWAGILSWQATLWTTKEGWWNAWAMHALREVTLIVDSNFTKNTDILAQELQETQGAVLHNWMYSSTGLWESTGLVTLRVQLLVL